ncbi:MAG: DUF5679 domain-containing protein [Dehalococcoidia bacterium]|jgi:DNA-directed RNA polymerase subunit RPC12/RpoP
MTAFCMKCHKETEIKDAKIVKMRNGRPATAGVCPSCGKKVFKISKT